MGNRERLITLVGLTLAFGISICRADTISSINDIQTGNNYNARTSISLFFPNSFTLSNGATYSSGAGSGSGLLAFLPASEQTVGNTSQYTLNAPIGSVFLGFYLQMSPNQFSSAAYITQGTFLTTAPLVVTVNNSEPSVGVMSGFLQLTDNQDTTGSLSYLPPFIGFGVPVGSIVPFQVTYTLQNETWHIGMKDDAFSYLLDGSIQVGAVAPEPGAGTLLALGLGAIVAVIWKRSKLKIPTN